MSDWEIAPKAVTENNLKQYAGIQNGYADGVNNENPNTELNTIDQELANPKLHPVARKALLEAKAGLSTDAGWEVAPKGSPSGARSDKSAGDDSGWSVAPSKGPAVPFQSGSAFKDTKDLVPDLGNLWDTFKKQWANRSNTPMTTEIAQKMMQDEHAAGSAVLDTVGAVPAMAVGGAHGLYEGIKSLDATKGLKTAGETMNKLLPSTLLGNESDHNQEGYKAAMAPLTGVMDTLNAIPQGYGEVLNAAGAPNAAAQVTDAGKLAIMATFGAKGSMELYKSLTGKDAKNSKDAATKLESLLNEPSKPTGMKQFGPANDRGIPGTLDEPQGQLFSEKEPAPTQPIPGDNQLGLFDKPVYSYGNDTPNTIPYELSIGDVGANHPGLSLDNMKQRMDTAEGPQPGNPGMVSPKMSDITSLPDRLSLVPKDEPPTSMPEVAKPIIEGNKANEQAAYEQYLEAFKTNKQDQINQAYTNLERAKQGDYSRMEGESELQFADRIAKIEEANQSRLAFLDHSNMDWQHSKDVLKDQSLMAQDKTIMMRGFLRNGDVGRALGILAENHPSRGYRELANWWMDKMGGLKVKMHNEPVLNLGEREVTGYYDPTIHEVGFSGLGATSPHTVLHELGHALTSKFINDRPNDVRVIGLKSLFNSLNTEGKFKDFTGVVNAKEFIAEAWSNPKFQEFLKTQHMNNKTVWQRFVDGVKSIFGIRTGIETNLSNAFEHAMDLGKQIIEAGEETPLSQFKKAGLPNKLADLMATKPKDISVDTGPNNRRLEAIEKMSGAAQAIKDYIPENFPIEVLQEAARLEKDVDQNILQRGLNQLTSGGLYQSLKTKNIIVKKTYESIGQASDRAQTLINTYVKDKANGILPSMRNMLPKEATDAVMARIIMDSQQMDYSAQKLAEIGMSERGIDYILKAKEGNAAAFKAVNEARAAAGLKPIDARLGYAVSRTLGDFQKLIFKEELNKRTGEVERVMIGKVGANTRLGLNKIESKIAAEHPEWIMGEEKFLGRGAHKDVDGTRQSQYREAMQILVDESPDSGNLMKVLSDTFKDDAYDYMNAKRHALAKKGIFGAEGREAWKSAHENAVNFMKAEITYMETMFHWGELSKSIEELKPLLSDETIKQPNAKAWADAYIDQSLGINPTKIGKTLNDFIGAVGDTTGVGSKNLVKFGSGVKSVTNTVLLSLNPMYLAINALQPFQGMPSIKALLASRGLESRFDASTGYTYLAQGLFSTLKDKTNGIVGGKMSEFETQMTKYGKEHHVFGNEIIDHSSQVEKGYSYRAGQLTDFGINAIESNTNRLVFSGVSHLLAESGMKVSEGLFEAAFKLTKEIMHDYRPMEAPMLFQQFGPMGNLAKNLTKYKTGEMSKLAAMAREIPDNGAYRPLIVTMASQIAFAGMLGLTGFHEADQIFQYLMKKLGHPMTLAGLVMNKLPEVASHGLGAFAGVDLSNRLGMSDVVPDTIGKALFGGGSKIADIATAGVTAIAHPSEMNTKRLLREAAPGVVTGPMDRAWFSTTNDKGEEMGISRKPSDFHNIQGQVVRNDADKFWKNFGATGVHESREKAVKYNNDLVSNNYTELRKGVISQLADDIFSNNRTIDKAALEKARDKYMSYEGDPNSFAADIQKELIDQKTDAKTRDLIKNATNNLSKINNLKRMFNKAAP